MGVHFDNCGQEFVKPRDHMYVDDLVNEGESINEFKKLKSDPIILFRQGGFKWHSKETILETKDRCTPD